MSINQDDTKDSNLITNTPLIESEEKPSISQKKNITV